MMAEMSNASLIGRMLQALHEYEAGSLSWVETERLFESHLQGLERIGLQQIHESRSISRRLVMARLADQPVASERVSAALADMRRFLRTLPDGQDAEPPETKDHPLI